jgi:hypothetical protein
MRCLRAVLAAGAAVAGDVELGSVATVVVERAAVVVVGAVVGVGVVDVVVRGTAVVGAVAGDDIVVGPAPDRDAEPPHPLITTRALSATTTERCTSVA